MGLFTEQSNYLIVGKTGSGKTAFGWDLASTISKLQRKKVYVFNFPKPQLLSKIPFDVENITRLDKAMTLKNCVVLFDEAHKIFGTLEKKVDDRLKCLLAEGRQNDRDCIFICHNSYFLNRSLFTFVNVRVIKEVNQGHWELERSFMKKLYEGVAVYGPNNYFIDSDWHRGNSTFEKPKWYTDIFSNAFRFEDKPINLFEEAIKNAEDVRCDATECAKARTNAR